LDAAVATACLTREAAPRAEPALPSRRGRGRSPVRPGRCWSRDRHHSFSWYPLTLAWPKRRALIGWSVDPPQQRVHIQVDARVVDQVHHTMPRAALVARSADHDGQVGVAPFPIRQWISGSISRVSTVRPGVRAGIGKGRRQLALLWGSTFPWIELALGALTPVQVTLSRCVLGSATLLAVCFGSGRRRLGAGRPGVTSSWPPYSATPSRSPCSASASRPSTSRWLAY
jgi:hypothetical protein